jgi:hypothetical protein
LVALPDPMLFCYVSEANVPAASGRLLAEACAQRGVPFREIEARRFDYDPAQRLQPGDLLFRGAVSRAASRAEQFLYVPGVATFHSESGDIRFGPVDPTLLQGSAGVPIPPTVYASCDDPELVQALVQRVGGFPVVLKVLGRSHGVGVMRLDSLPSLLSVLGFALAQGHHPQLSTYVAEAMHWRLVLVGDRVAAHYRNPYRPADFRSRASRDPLDYLSPPPEAVAEAALAAVRAERLEFAGVDVLEDPSGRPWVLEANFPCYFPQAQLVAGVDVAGAMVEFLMAKSQRLQGHGSAA